MSVLAGSEVNSSVEAEVERSVVGTAASFEDSTEIRGRSEPVSSIVDDVIDVGVSLVETSELAVSVLLDERSEFDDSVVPGISTLSLLYS